MPAITVGVAGTLESGAPGDDRRPSDGYTQPDPAEAIPRQHNRTAFDTGTILEALRVLVPQPLCPPRPDLIAVG